MELSVKDRLYLHNIKYKKTTDSYAVLDNP